MSSTRSPIVRGILALIGTALGPLGARGGLNKLVAVLLTLLLTLFTQVGGVILWPFWYAITHFAAKYNRAIRWTLQPLVLIIVYLIGGLWVLPELAKERGRVRLPLFATEELPTGPQNFGYALLLRNYVHVHTYKAYTEAVQRFGKKHPGAIVRYLDAGFPYYTTPLLPHLSHRDGQRIDVAFLFQENGEYVDRTLSPIGYWGYAKESPPRPECDGKTMDVGPIEMPLRWDFDWLQAYWPDLQLDVKKTRALLNELAKDKRVCSILLEPGLHRPLRAPKLRKNGCRVARHDDHFHLTIRQQCSYAAKLRTR